MHETENNTIIKNIALNYRNAQNQLQSFNPIVQKFRSQYYENYKFSYIFFLLRLFFINPFFREKPVKYIFQSLRYKEIIKSLNPSEVLILGNRSEFDYCKKNKYKFHWIGYLYHSTCIYLSKKNNFYLNKSINLLKKIIGINNNQHKYIFLWSDIELSGLVLSAIFENKKNFSVICIAHGFHFKPKKGLFYLNDGHYCKYNLVWNSKQIQLFRNLKYSPFVLGLPYNIIIPKKVSNKIILIGHGEVKSNVYEKTLQHFKLIYSLIDKNLFDVEYRPHTTEGIKKPKKYFSKINNENKLNLLQDSKKIYIGFVSSLLYEASMHNNYVIELK